MTITEISEIWYDHVVYLRGLNISRFLKPILSIIIITTVVVTVTESQEHSMTIACVLELKNK